jgi:hypothetical protein
MLITPLPSNAQLPLLHVRNASRDENKWLCLILVMVFNYARPQECVAATRRAIERVARTNKVLAGYVKT